MPLTVAEVTDIMVNYVHEFLSPYELTKVSQLSKELLGDNLLWAGVMRIYFPEEYQRWAEVVRRYFPEEYQRLIGDELEADTNWRQQFGLLCQDKFSKYHPSRRLIYFYAWQGNIEGLKTTSLVERFKFAYDGDEFLYTILDYADNQQVIRDYVYSCRKEARQFKYKDQYIHNLYGVESHSDHLDFNLHRAVRIGNLEQVQRILNLVPRAVNNLNIENKTPLDILLRCFQDKSYESSANCYAIYQLLRANGAIIYWSHLNMACKLGWACGVREIVMDILAQGYMLRDRHLRVAVRTYDVEKVEFLLNIYSSYSEEQRSEYASLSLHFGSLLADIICRYIDENKVHERSLAHIVRVLLNHGAMLGNIVVDYGAPTFEVRRFTLLDYMNQFNLTYTARIIEEHLALMHSATQEEEASSAPSMRV